VKVARYFLGVYQNICPGGNRIFVRQAAGYLSSKQQQDICPASSSRMFVQQAAGGWFVLQAAGYLSSKQQQDICPAGSSRIFVQKAAGYCPASSSRIFVQQAAPGYLSGRQQALQRL
jgi:hypothetical protein